MQMTIKFVLDVGDTVQIQFGSVFGTLSILDSWDRAIAPMYWSLPGYAHAVTGVPFFSWKYKRSGLLLNVLPSAVHS